MENPKVGVAAIIIRDGKVLLIKRKGVHGQGSWSTPGGHLENGETPEQCAIRETCEEAGVEIANARFQAVTNDIFPDSGKHYITIWMQGLLVSGKPRIASEYEVAEIGWFAWDALPAPLFIPFQNLVGHNSYPQDAIENIRGN